MDASNTRRRSGEWFANSTASAQSTPHSGAGQRNPVPVPPTLNTPMVDHLRAMAVFAAVVRSGSFRGAARELNLAPSVVSHHVSSLEQRLRVVLLYRSTRKLDLTADGKRLFEVTSALLQSTENAFRQISRCADDPSGMIRVSAPAATATASSPLMQHFASFMQLYPRVQLAMHLSEDSANASDGEHDLVLLVCWPDQVKRRMKKLHSVPGRLVASRAYLARRTPPVQPSDLATWDWIRFQPRPAEMEFTHADKGVVHVRGIERASVDSLPAILNLVLNGIGVARLPDFLSDPNIASGELIELLPDWKLTSPGIYAILPPEVPRSGILWKLYQHLLVQTAETDLISRGTVPHPAARGPATHAIRAAHA